MLRRQTLQNPPTRSACGVTNSKRSDVIETKRFEAKRIESEAIRKRSDSKAKRKQSDSAAKPLTKSARERAWEGGRVPRVSRGSPGGLGWVSVGPRHLLNGQMGPRYPLGPFQAPKSTKKQPPRHQNYEKRLPFIW